VTKICFSLVSVIAVIISGCSEAPAPVASPPPSVVVHVVESESVEIRREFIGRTQAIQRVDIRARVTGILQERGFTEGASVAEGDLLFKIEPDTYVAQTEQAIAQVEADKARLVETSANLKRMEALFNKGVVSAQDYEDAKAVALIANAAVQGSEAALKQAQLNLSYVDISAPASGMIGETTIDTGNLIGPDSGVLVTVVQLDPIHVHFTVSDVEYLNFRRQNARQNDGPQVAPQLKLSDNTDYELPGQFQLIGNEVDPGTGNITLRAEFPNPELLLRPGQFVTVVFETTRSETALTVPQAAVLASQAGYSVLVVNVENRVEKRAIKTGERMQGSWVVTEGLNEGDQIILRGLQKVRPGQLVNPTKNN